MITITKTKKGHYVVQNVSDKNGKIIKSSEPLNSRQSAIKNIVAEMKLYEKYVVYIKDVDGANRIIKKQDDKFSLI